MSTGLANRTYDHGGMCYAGCMEAFEWYLNQLITSSPLGGTPHFFGAKRAVTLLAGACQTPSSGMLLPHSLQILGKKQTTCAKCLPQAITPCKSMRTLVSAPLIKISFRRCGGQAYPRDDVLSECDKPLQGLPGWRPQAEVLTPIFKTPCFILSLRLRGLGFRV